MIISRLKIKNFRGYAAKTIDFSNKPVVLIYASNGVGKTTIIDAIEWCLTGSIGRLKQAFDMRSSNESERKLNTEGIIKNRDAGTNETIEVELWLQDEGREMRLCRVQKKDELKPNASTVTLDGSEDAARVFRDGIVGDSFYNYHFCDVQKSFNVQSTKRSDLESLFRDFITNYDDKLQIAKNIEVFAEDTNRYIEDKEKAKVSQEIISSNESQLEKLQEEAKLIDYPNQSFYAKERLDIYELSREELLVQKNDIKDCGYSIATNSLSKLVKNETLSNRKILLNSILSFWNDNENIISQAKGLGLLDDSTVVSSLETKLQKLELIAINRETVISALESIEEFKNARNDYQDYYTDKASITEKETKIKELSSEIELLSSNNKLLKLLSNLDVNKSIIVEYRNDSLKKDGKVKCPICGSELFASVDEELILKEADEYIKKNGEIVKKKEIEKTSLESEIEKLYINLINIGNAFVEKEKKVLESQIENLKSIQTKLKPLFELIEKLKTTEKDITVQEIDKPKVLSLLSEIDNQLLSEEAENSERELYQKILTVLGYDFINETVAQTFEMVNSLTSEDCVVTNFSYDVFVTKLNAIDSVLANQEMFILKDKIKADKAKNEKLNEEIKGLQILYGLAIKRANDIKSLVEELSKEEYEKVGPALKQFYNKLIRVDDNDGINLVHENEGISLVDDKGKNIVNVLSNGQICVFMLAYFFAGINARNEDEKIKVFFIDDLTACMDDVNMLAFMDLLKYQMDSKETMEQLFFVTCDNRISNLLKYKLCGREIGVCELQEQDLAR